MYVRVKKLALGSGAGHDLDQVECDVQFAIQETNPPRVTLHHENESYAFTNHKLCIHTCPRPVTGEPPRL